jgi:hypothetical protein
MWMDMGLDSLNDLKMINKVILTTPMYEYDYKVGFCDFYSLFTTNSKVVKVFGV